MSSIFIPRPSPSPRNPPNAYELLLLVWRIRMTLHHSLRSDLSYTKPTTKPSRRTPSAGTLSHIFRIYLRTTRLTAYPPQIQPNKENYSPSRAVSYRRLRKPPAELHLSKLPKSKFILRPGDLKRGRGDVTLRTVPGVFRL